VSPSPAITTRAGPSFRCWSTQNGDGAAHIRLHGELDLATTAEVERALGDALEQALNAVVDLRGLEFMDSAGVHTLVDATTAARRASRRVLVIPGPPPVDALFGLTGTADAVQVVARPRDAP
jgi:anti-anti-sigma factor